MDNGDLVDAICTVHGRIDYCTDGTSKFFKQPGYVEVVEPIPQVKTDKMTIVILLVGLLRKPN